MKIALDYDGTVTEDPECWHKFVELFQKDGHDIRIVTFRKYDEITSDLRWFADTANIPIVCTERTLKQAFCRSIGWEPDIWIDDSPALIGHDDGVWSEEKLSKWREQTLSNRVFEKLESSGDSQSTENIAA